MMNLMFLKNPLISFTSILGISIGWIVFQIIQAQAYVIWSAWVPVLMWIVGSYTGYGLLVFDRFVDIYVANPHTKLSTYVKQFVAEGQYWKAWQIIALNKKLQKRLVFRSAVFQVVWLALALFTVTSTASLFGKGVVLGLGIHLLLDEWNDYFDNKEHLKQWLFWQVNRDFTDSELLIYLGTITLAVIGLLLFIF